MIGLASYAASLLATLPARLVVPGEAAGTIWHGEAAIGAGHVAAWRWSPLASLARFGLAADWTAEGPGSSLRGVATWRPFGGVELAKVAGRAGWPLVALAAPNLPFACDFDFSVSLDRVSLRDRFGVGTVLGGPGTCSGRVPGDSRTVPRLIAVLTPAGGTVTPWARRATRLADFTVLADMLRLRITSAGAALLPGATGPSELEIEL